MIQGGSPNPTSRWLGRKRPPPHCVRRTGEPASAQGWCFTPRGSFAGVGHFVEVSASHMGVRGFKSRRMRTGGSVRVEGTPRGSIGASPLVSAAPGAPRCGWLTCGQGCGARPWCQSTVDPEGRLPAEHMAAPSDVLAGPFRPALSRPGLSWPVLAVVLRHFRTLAGGRFVLQWGALARTGWAHRAHRVVSMPGIFFLKKCTKTCKKLIISSVPKLKFHF